MSHSTALSWFLTIARAEGLSLLLLFFVAMPLKYGAGMPEPVRWVGWVHGILFLAYVAALAVAARVEGWSLARTTIAGVASMVPFGTFAFERSVVDRPAA